MANSKRFSMAGAGGPCYSAVNRDSPDLSPTSRNSSLISNSRSANLFSKKKSDVSVGSGSKKIVAQKRARNGDYAAGGSKLQVSFKKHKNEKAVINETSTSDNNNENKV